MFELIVGILVVVALIYVVVYIVFPILSIVALIAGIGGGLVTFYMYIRAAVEYANPYHLPTKVYSRMEADVYEYHGKNHQENVKRRSYFFGPGFYSLWRTWTTSWKYNWVIVKTYWDWMTAKKNSIISDGFRTAMTVILWTGLLAMGASVLVLGGFISIGVGLLHAAIMLVVMSVVYLAYSIIRGADYIYLWKNSITSMCPHCKRRYVIPVYACNNCGAKHKRLVPSPYGILHHECTCGNMLSATFFNGRNHLEAFCPHCTDERLASSSSRQFCISLVGGSSSGKTTLLASYLHVMRQQLEAEGIHVAVDQDSEKKVKRLEDAYQNAEQLTGTLASDYTDPYTMILSGGGLSFSRQFNIFDVAGEIFHTPDLGGITFGQDFADSEGIVITVDPLASHSLRREVSRAGISVTTASVFDPSVVVNNLANYLRQTSTKTGHMIVRPTAVVVTKTDIPQIGRDISSETLAREMSLYPGEAMDIRDHLLRNYLDEIGMGTLLMALDANYSNVHFFSVSATGGSQPGESYSVDSAMHEPFDWLISASGDKEFAQALHLSPEI